MGHGGHTEHPKLKFGSLGAAFVDENIAKSKSGRENLYEKTSSGPRAILLAVAH